jgi:hypothetical protein
MRQMEGFTHQSTKRSNPWLWPRLQRHRRRTRGTSPRSGAINAVRSASAQRRQISVGHRLRAVAASVRGTRRRRRLPVRVLVGRVRRADLRSAAARACALHRHADQHLFSAIAVLFSLARLKLYDLFHRTAASNGSTASCQREYLIARSVLLG